MAIKFMKTDFKTKPLEKIGMDKKSIVKVLKQTGKTPNLPRDQGRPARLPGKRISKSGKEYWETRKNRSDAPGKRV